MNICEDRHEPKYQITYNGNNQTNKNTRVWLVCESCFNTKDCFNTGVLVKKIQ